MSWSEDRRFVSRELLTELFGADGAARVVKVFGGKRIYVPAPATEGYSNFAGRIGDEKIAHKVCVEFGGTQIALPKQLVPMNEQIIELDRGSVKPTEIAQRLSCTESYVYYVLREERRPK
jgi:hypothetical protein